MLPLFDMLQSAGNGRGMELLARQFALSKQQAELAVEALLPAFSEGLKRNTADPFGMGGFMKAMTGGDHVRTFEDAARAFTPAGLSEGNKVLGQLFGSPDLSRAIAEQAARATGLAQDMLKQMMPALASLLMGGLAKQAATPESGGPFGEMMRLWTQAGAVPQAGAAGSANPFDNPFSRAMAEMFAGAKPGQAGAAAPTDNPFAKMFEAMNPGLRGATREREPGPRGGTPETPADFYSLFGQMFETGRKQREDYEKTIGALFDQFGRGAGPAGSM